MAGEYILKLLIEENARIELGDNWLVCHGDTIRRYTVYQSKPGQRRIALIESTEDEQEACRILKGE